MADEITDAEIAELRLYVAHPAGYHMSREVLSGLLARLERAEREREVWDEAEIAIGQATDRLRERIATLEAALRTALRELETWRDTANLEEWGGVALRLTNEAIGEARAALRGVEGKP